MSQTQEENDNDFKLPIPKMNICFLIVGTHGDINPFLGLADCLVEQGHCVRVATHQQHRKLVLTSGHDFFPLAGDARQLSEWMVQTGGTLIGEAKRLDVVPQKTRMAKEIVASTWDAVTKPSPDDLDSKPFEADAVIANPPVFGHVHVCEALGIPLHIMFPQPWYYGTRDYPHPLMGMSYEHKADINFTSYAAFEAIAFSSMAFYVNKWRRTTLDLPVINMLYGAPDAIPSSKIPFSAMWSPSFVPKPQDWPEQCRVVGTFTKQKVLGGRASLVEIDTTPFQDLVEWLYAGPKPIFVGFGSMVIRDTTALAEIIIKAAQQADCRVVVQSSWSKIDVSSSEGRCHGVGPCPHDWLLPQTCAVVHHGGAGTTAAGLRYGLPTFVCPFFGDQHMWAEMVRRAGVGPSPCSVWKLTDALLAEKFVELQKQETRDAAKKLAAEMKKEDGIQGGLDHFLSDLPLDNMLCDVSLMLGEVRMAKYFAKKYGIKLSINVVAVSKSIVETPFGAMTSMDYFREWWKNMESAITQAQFRVERHQVTRFALGRVQSFPQGCIAGILGFFRHILLTIIQPCYRSDMWARSYGMVGCLAGAILSPFYMLMEVFRAIVVLMDRLVTGCCNGCRGKSYLYTLDLHREEGVREKGYVQGQVDELVAHGFSKERKQQVFQAGQYVIVARTIFDSTKPEYPEGQWHYKVAKASSLSAAFQQKKDKLKLSTEESEALRSMFQQRQGESLSFSMTLLMLRKAISVTATPSTQFGSGQVRQVSLTPVAMDLWQTLFDTFDTAEEV